MSASASRRPPVLELVTIGNELLLGETVDTNGAWLGRRLAELGLRVVRRVTVGDDDAAIREAVGEALDRTGVVVCSGGLGPTSDDRTKPVVAGLFGRRLVSDPAILATVRSRFERRGLSMPESSRGQADVPEGGLVLPNPRGTAPGLVLDDEDGRFVILLPGVPAELRGLVDEQVMPLLAARMSLSGPVLHRSVRTFGLTESGVAERVEGIVAELAPLTVAFLPSESGVDLRVTSWGSLDRQAAERALARAAGRLAAALGHAVYSDRGRDLAEVVHERLVARRLRLAVAESCTAGMLAARLTDAPGASAFLLGGAIAYADEAKVRLLDVNPRTLREHGAVSEETALEMAIGARASLDADLAVAITGIAGPDGGTAEKPVGTVWVGAVSADARLSRLLRLAGERSGIRARSVQGALQLLLRLIGPADVEDA